MYLVFEVMADSPRAMPTLNRRKLMTPPIPRVWRLSAWTCPEWNGCTRTGLSHVAGLHVYFHASSKARQHEHGSIICERAEISAGYCLLTQEGNLKPEYEL